METLSLWSLVMDGGYIMIPLALMLIVSIYIFVERCLAISRASKEDSSSCSASATTSMKAT